MKKTHAKKTASPKRRSSKHSAPRGQSAGTLWLMAALVLALFILGLVYLHYHRKHQYEPPAAKKTLKKTTKAHSQTKTTKTEPKFDFYTMLPDMQVGEETAKASQSKAPIAEAKASAVKHKYVLQAGAFKRYEDADKVRANLILQGFTVQIKAVDVKGVTWQRIIIGPYNSLADAQKAQAKLDKGSIKSLLFQIA